ncbi:MAG: shikimate dehydrogenase [Muribaculaceae bacterium]|nr:shikimate dehydrogenase [Muribaculaceae bacterium]
MLPGLYGLIGRPLKHSFSKFFFDNLIQHEGLASVCRYELFELPDASAIAPFLQTPHLRGFNVTSPYKRDILPYLSTLCGCASELGAVNCVCICGEGPVGYNTDAPAFEEDIKSYLTGVRCNRALICGTGGAASAAAYALRKLGFEILFASRTAGDSRVSYQSITPQQMKSFAVIVQATPLGMHPRMGECVPLPYDAIEPATVCYDMIYNPSETEFLKRCQRQGAVVSNGYGMLIRQALLSQEIWSGNLL